MARGRARFPACAMIALFGCASSTQQVPAASPPSSDEEKTKLTPQEVAERTIPAIALIRTANGLGTGFVVRTDGRIATNLHVIAGAHEATVVLADSREFDNIMVVAADEAHDLVVLQVPVKNLFALELGDSSTVLPGEPIVAIGHPLGLGNTVSNGLISAVRAIRPNLTMLQISAPISPGSSGGPLINDRGEVIGISTLVFASGQNLNFGMPVNYLKAMLESSTPQPLAEFTAALARSRPKRAIPNHDTSVLEDCSKEEIEVIEKAILAAIKLGAPLYDDGNPEACFRVYEGAALDVDRSVKKCTGAKKALLDGVKMAGKHEDYPQKAWAMRDAFDGLLEVIAKKTSRRLIPKREVPKHEISLLKNCSQKTVEHFAVSIAGAIEIGAPLYNQGNAEACFRVYEGAALELADKKDRRCPGAAKALEEGLDRASKLASYEEKAWAMRDTFDGLLKVLETKMRQSD